MSPSLETFLPLIYQTIHDPTLWNAYLDEFARVMRASVALLTIISPKYPDVSVVAMGGPVATPEHYETWRTKWADQDPWVSGRDMFPYGLGKIELSQNLCPDEQLEATRIYQEFLEPHGIHYGGGVALAHGADQLSIHSMSRPKELGPLTADEVALWESHLPHLMAAVAAQGRIQAAEIGHDIVRSFFDQERDALFLLSRTGQPLSMNTAALALVHSRETLFIDAAHTVTLRDKRLHPQLLRHIHRCGYPGQSPFPEPAHLVVPRDNQRPLIVQISSLVRPGETTTASSRPAVALRVLDPDRATLPDPRLLQSVFGLTEAETQFCCRLAAGLTVEEVAEASFVSVHTARTHLKRVLRKTGATRQAELLVMFQRLVTSKYTI